MSTVREAEALEPLVREGVVRDILYGLPLPPSALPRLAALRSRNPGLAVTLLVDHPAQLPRDGGAWGVFVKLDNGYQRAGVLPESQELKTLVAAIRETEGVRLVGFYSHAGHSYASGSYAESVRFLVRELETVLSGAEGAGGVEEGLVLSVGATPTALAAGWDVAELLGRAGDRWSVELHAGVYALMDLQQLAPRPPGCGLADVALTVMAEVASVYGSRGEALVALGSTGLGREPGGAAGGFPGWGLVSGWTAGGEWTGAERGGWIVGRISQEHAVLVGDGECAERMELAVGQKVRVWPQHACIAGNGHGWYFVTEDGVTVSDIWVRWRGW